MITAIDTNILLDVLVPGSAHGDASERALDDALQDGSLIISEPVFAELSPQFDREGGLRALLARLNVDLVPSSAGVLHVAGHAWAAYSRRRAGFVCPKCGAGNQTCRACRQPLSARQHIVSDFVIGAHASINAARLLTRDYGHYRRYFPSLELI